MASIKDTTEALKILSSYEGKNPYVMKIKRGVYMCKENLNDFQIEFILKNHSFIPIQINKITKIADWFGLLKQKKVTAQA